MEPWTKLEMQLGCFDEQVKFTSSADVATSQRNRCRILREISRGQLPDGNNQRRGRRQQQQRCGDDTPDESPSGFRRRTKELVGPQRSRILKVLLEVWCVCKEFVASVSSQRCKKIQ